MLVIKPLQITKQQPKKTKYSKGKAKVVKVSKPLGEKLPIEESNNLDTKVVEEVEGTTTVDNTDPSLSRPF